MRTNNIVTKMTAGETAYGCFINFPSTAVVELIGIAGFDFVHFDNEHGPFTSETIDDLCRVADMAGLTPIARPEKRGRIRTYFHHAIRLSYVLRDLAKAS